LRRAISFGAAYHASFRLDSDGEHEQLSPPMKGSGLAIARTPGGEIVLIRTGDGGRNRGRTSQPSYTRGIHSAGSWQQPIDDEHARQRRLYAL